MSMARRLRRETERNNEKVYHKASVAATAKLLAVCATILEYHLWELMRAGRKGWHKRFLELFQEYANMIKTPTPKMVEAERRFTEQTGVEFWREDE